ncbi:tetratricopeptide repeat protein [Streptomyces sp. NPDC127110]|uniref:tetratricopeptide repeat protein n=1 Tax=Streptomyces sp. NPDC127110 TaxID=3345362 RepID=UPI0036342F90
MTAFERLAEATPCPWQADLAHAMRILGQRELVAGRYEEALGHFTRAVEMYRTLPRRTAGQEADRLKLTMDLATVYRMYDRHSAALEILQEVLPTARRWAKTNPARGETHLCTLLSNLAIALDRAGSPPEALETAREAVSLARKLYAADPVVHGNALVVSLITLAHRLARWNTQESISTAADAVHVARQCVRYHGDAELPALGLALRVLREHLLGGGRPVEAIGPAREAVEILRTLVEREPGIHGDELQDSEERLALLTSGKAVIGFHTH